MSHPYLFGKDIDLMGLLGKIFDISTGHCHDGSDSRYIAYRTLAVGATNVAGATKAVALATIEATDVVTVTPTVLATATYVLKVAVTAATGFVVTMGEATVGSISYVVRKAT